MSIVLFSCSLSLRYASVLPEKQKQQKKMSVDITAYTVHINRNNSFRYPVPICRHSENQQERKQLYIKFCVCVWLLLVVDFVRSMIPYVYILQSHKLAYYPYIIVILQRFQFKFKIVSLVSFSVSFLGYKICFYIKNCVCFHFVISKKQPQKSLRIFFCAFALELNIF